MGETLDVIEPTVVLASGDLTDAKDSDNLGSRQYREEWQIYHDIIQQGHVHNKTIWLDIRGNHGNRELLSSILYNFTILLIF